MRRLVIAIVIAGALAGGAFAATKARWSGGLGSGYGGVGVGLPVRVGRPFSVGLMDLRPRGRVVIESVRLHGSTPGVVLVGSLLYPAGGGMVGGDPSFPPRWPRFRMRRADGAALHAHRTTLLVVGLRLTHPGTFDIHGFDLLYRERWHGIELRHRAHIGPLAYGCAVRTSAKLPRCRMPRPDY